jgi:hypothetical protein
MEKLNKDLFKDTSIEETQKRVAGYCACQIGGNSYCRTLGGGFDLADIGGG